jgi:Domain of unknown function (DUF4174)
MPKKLSLIFLILLGTCAAQEPVSSLAQLQANSRLLLVFAPDANSPNFKMQLELIQRHSFELSARNTVFVAISTASKYGEEKFSFENLPLGTAREQAEARTRFHVQPGDFLVLLIDEKGTQQIRSAVPVAIHELTASLDSLPPRQ